MTAPHRTRLERRGGYLIVDGRALPLTPPPELRANGDTIGFPSFDVLIFGWTLAEVLDVIEGSAQGAPTDELTKLRKQLCELSERNDGHARRYREICEIVGVHWDNPVGEIRKAVGEIRGRLAAAERERDDELAKGFV